MKKILILCLCLFSFNSIFSQLRLDQNGKVHIGIGSSTWDYKSQIYGDLLFANNMLTSAQLRIRIGGSPGTEIGSSADKIAFWYTGINYHKLYAEDYYRQSDSKFKKNIVPISSPIKKIQALKPYFYEFTDGKITETNDTVQESQKQYGFIAQDVEVALNEVKITDDEKGIKLMDYDQIIPLLAAGIQEQQKQIGKLEAQIAKLVAKSNANLGNAGGNGNGNNPMDVSKLNNNTPNPFSSNTQLKYYLNENTSAVIEIKVWCMQGIERKNYQLENIHGNSQVNLVSTDLPSHGSYVYALIIDGQIIDAKTLILQ